MTAAYPLLKLVHILSATVLLGTGLGSAFFLWRTYRTGDLVGLVAVIRVVVTVDRVFITPSVIVQLVTGVWLVLLLRRSFFEPWIVSALVLYALAAGCWLPAVWLQRRMCSLAEEALEEGRSDLPSRFHRYETVWARLGIVAFTAVVTIVYLMVFKPALW